MVKKWITFDLDGTLMQNPFVDWVFPEIEKLVNGQLTERRNITSMLVEKHEKLMANSQTLEAYDWDAILLEVLEDLDLDQKLSINVEELVLKHTVKPKVYLLEECIPETLRQLQEADYSLAVVTNGYYKYQYPVLKELGIVQYFDEIITPETNNCSKPDPRILDSIRNEGEVVAHIGDRIDHDVCMSNTLGIPSIFINKNLPEGYEEIPFTDRIKNTEIEKLCQEKWARETKDKEFTDQCKPSVIIGSIKELIAYFKVEL